MTRHDGFTGQERQDKTRQDNNEESTDGIHSKCWTELKHIKSGIVIVAEKGRASPTAFPCYIRRTYAHKGRNFPQLTPKKQKKSECMRHGNRSMCLHSFRALYFVVCFACHLTTLYKISYHLKSCCTSSGFLNTSGSRMDTYGEVPTKCPLGTVKLRPLEVTVKSFFAMRSKRIFAYAQPRHVRTQEIQQIDTAERGKHHQ